jgi:hypothetical protein
MADVSTVTDRGLEIINDRIMSAGTEPKYIAWGTGTTAPVVGNTALETPAAEARTSGTSSKVTTTTTSDTYQVVGTIVATSTAKAITEVGLLDASTSGNLFMRATFSVINVSVGDSIAFTIKTQLDQA